MTNFSQEYINLIIDFIISVNNFCYTNLILLISLWNWWLYLTMTTKYLCDDFIALLFIFWHFSRSPNWRIILHHQFWNLLCQHSTVLFVLWSAFSTALYKFQVSGRSLERFWSSASSTPSKDIPSPNIIY